MENEAQEGFEIIKLKSSTKSLTRVIDLDDKLDTLEEKEKSLRLSSSSKDKDFQNKLLDVNIEIVEFKYKDL